MPQKISFKKLFSPQLIASTAIGVLIGAGIVFLILTAQNKTANQNTRIRDFYEIENAVYVSPHSLRKKMDKNDKSYILVDLRSAQEYQKEHIISAINIPAYKDPDTPAYEDEARIIGAFSDLPKDKEVIVYCYSMPCMTGRKVGKMLAESNIFVKHLGIGWNEWRWFWTLWNHEHEWQTTKAEDYVTSGPEPGTPKLKDSLSPCTQGELGC